MSRKTSPIQQWRNMDAMILSRKLRRAACAVRDMQMVEAYEAGEKVEYIIASHRLVSRGHFYKVAHRAGVALRQIHKKVNRE